MKEFATVKCVTYNGYPYIFRTLEKKVRREDRGKIARKL